jgi:hypothetical protein
MIRPPARAASALLLAAAPLFLGLLLVGGRGRVAEAAPQGPAVEVRTLAAGTLQGTLEGLDENALRIQRRGAADEQALPLDGVIDLTFTGPAGAERPQETASELLPMRAFLVGGGMLVGTFRGPSKEGILLEVPGLGTLDLVFDILLTLERVVPSRGGCSRLKREYPRPESGDLAYDMRDDEYAGSVYGATASALVMEGSDERTRDIPWERLRVLLLENQKLEDVQGLHAEVELRQGSRVQVAGPVLLTRTGIRATLRALPGKAFDIPFSALHTLRWSGGSFVYAPDVPHEMKRRHQYPDKPGTMDLTWYEPWFGGRVDQRSDGCPLVIDGRTYRRGFGVLPHSTITLTLEGSYRSFQAGLGIDDSVLRETGETGTRGNVDARVIGDGKVLWEAKDIEGGNPVTQVGPLDVSGVKSLVLEIGFGKEIYMLDRADWVDPILVRK